MSNNKENLVDSNKRIIEQIVDVVGKTHDLQLKTSWIDAASKTDNYTLKIFCEGHKNPAVLAFPSRELSFKTYVPDPEEDVEVFTRNEQELRPESYERKRIWKERIDQAVQQQFLQGHRSIGFTT